MKARKGDWVQVKAVILPPGRRAPGVPEDTSRVPLEMRVKGHILEDADLGQEVTIETVMHRKLRGTLEMVKPRHTHGFGEVVSELLMVGPELRALLRREGQ